MSGTIQSTSEAHAIRNEMARSSSQPTARSPSGTCISTQLECTYILSGPERILIYCIFFCTSNCIALSHAFLSCGSQRPVTWERTGRLTLTHWSEIWAWLSDPAVACCAVRHACAWFHHTPMKPLIVLEHDYSIGVDSIVVHWPGVAIM